MSWKRTAHGTQELIQQISDSQDTQIMRFMWWSWGHKVHKAWLVKDYKYYTARSKMRLSLKCLKALVVNARLRALQRERAIRLEREAWRVWHAKYAYRMAGANGGFRELPPALRAVATVFRVRRLFSSWRAKTIHCRYMRRIEEFRRERDTAELERAYGQWCNEAYYIQQDIERADSTFRGIVARRMAKRLANVGPKLRVMCDIAQAFIILRAWRR
ncbi:hypothetical protein EV182_006499, partial [Spiromyces aspiralis]